MKDFTRYDLNKIADKEYPYPVKFGEYAIIYTPRKQLSIMKYRTPDKIFHYDKKKGYVPDYELTCTLWDVIGFFQSTFLEAVEKWLGKDYEDYKLILEGKSLRYDFKNVNIDFIKRYNEAELKALVKLMEKLHESLTLLELPITRYDGAGAIASAMCRKYEVKSALGIENEEGVWNKLVFSPELQQACQCAYFGGRIELIQYGYHQGKVYHYDINSAYPNIQRTLPALSKGRFVKTKERDLSKLNDFSLCRVRWTTPHCDICPFPYRSELQLKILFPDKGMGWYWLPEVKAAFEVKASSEKYSKWSIKVKEVYTFKPDIDCYKPYEFIERYYDYRQQLIRESKETGALNGQEKVIKLGLNSLYGKTAQHIGYKVSTGHIPTLHNLAYAGYVTSGTRAMIYKAAMTAPGSIIAIATDGIFSTAPLQVECSTKKELGLWEYTEHDSMIMVQAGFYWILEKGKWRGLSRGFDRVQGQGKTIEEKEADYQHNMRKQIQTLLTAWQEKQSCCYFPCTRFITLASALVSDNWFKRWRTWYELGTDLFHKGEQPVIGRKLALTVSGTKRMDNYSPRAKNINPWLALIKTSPMENHAEYELSKPYILPWTVNESDEQEVEGVPIMTIELEAQHSSL
jgi:hypothetical protein